MNNMTLRIMLEEAIKKGFRIIPEAFCIGNWDPPGLLTDDFLVMV